MLIYMGLSFALLFFFFLLSERFSKGDLADFGWTLSVAGWALVSFPYEAPSLRATLLLCLVLLWGGRLGMLILRWRLLRPGEDSRYARFRESWGAQRKRNFFLLFMSQPILAALLSIPFIVGFEQNVLSVFDMLGVGLWLVGFTGVFVADRQLQRHKLEGQGVCQVGLWSYSRHPNYFFEWILWVSYPLFCVSSDFLSVSILSPVLMLYLLLFVTGVPPSERQALRSKGEAYKAYQERVSMFVPWPTKQQRE